MRPLSRPDPAVPPDAAHDGPHGRPALTGGEPIAAGRLFRFAALGMPLAAVEVPLGIYLPPLYASALGFDLVTVGLVFLVARLWDAAIDPGIGILSDRTRSRFGRRRPWIAVGGAIVLLGAILVFLPPAGAGAGVLLLGLCTLYLGCSMIATPYAAWAGELAGQYHERTRILTYGQVMTSLGLLLALVLPRLLADRLAGVPRLELAGMGAMAAVLLVPALLTGLTALPEPPPTPRPAEPESLVRALRLASADRLLLRVLAASFAARLGQGLRTAVFVFFVAHFMGRPGWAHGLFLLQYLFGIVACPLWLVIGRRLGKSRAAVVGELAQTGINLALLLLEPAGTALLVALTVAQGLTQGSGTLMCRAIVADVADHHRLVTGHDRIGLFYAVLSLTDKAALALAVGAALPLLALCGFDPRAPNDPVVLGHLRDVFALGPALGHLLSAAIIRGFALSEHRHSEIRRQLAVRDASGSSREFGCSRPHTTGRGYPS